MSVIIEELFHPFYEELKFSETDVSTFQSYPECPCCSTTSPQPTHLVYLGQERWQSNIAVVQCPECELIYYLNPPSENFIANYYQSK
ncbi:MAG: hypothetical protein ACPGYT_13130, partial [Nitrospirales bacterium]